MPPESLPTVPIIDTKRCSGCGRCVASCPQRIITLELADRRKHAVLINPSRCTACGACQDACPLGAIHQAPFCP